MTQIPIIAGVTAEMGTILMSTQAGACPRMCARLAAPALT